MDWQALQIFQKLRNILTTANQALFYSYSKANREILKSYTNILMEQKFLTLIYYYYLMCLLLFFLILKRFTCYCLVVISSITCIIIFIHIIIHLSLYSNKFYIDITISRSCPLSMNVLNRALFLKVSFLFLLLAPSIPETLILPFTTIYAYYTHINLILIL